MNWRWGLVAALLSIVVFAGVTSLVWSGVPYDALYLPTPVPAVQTLVGILPGVPDALLLTAVPTPVTPPPFLVTVEPELSAPLVPVFVIPPLESVPVIRIEPLQRLLQVLYFVINARQ